MRDKRIDMKFGCGSVQAYPQLTEGLPISISMRSSSDE